MRIALAQINPIVGDIAGNVAKMIDAIDRAADDGAELTVFSELSLCGYPPRDLLLKPKFVADTLSALDVLAKHCTGTAALVGHVRPNDSPTGRLLLNAAALLADGACMATHVKTLLPSYDVFDETRYFEPGPAPRPLLLGKHRIGVTICEDLWDPTALGRQLYNQPDVAAVLAAGGAEVLINMSASPYQLGKHAVRTELITRQAKQFALPVVFVNQVGGNDELIFDGASCTVDRAGRLLAQCRDFTEQLLVVDLDGPAVGGTEALREGMASLKAALELGLRDYVVKCGFSKVVLGLSGGIDSAVVAVLAADALGPGNVVGVAMPSRYSSGQSTEDARSLAKNLGIDFRVIPIEPMHVVFEEALAGAFVGTDRNVAEQNIQARTRGIVIMALSNKFGYLALATGNKSELAVGYCTLYGDMCGGLSVIGDVPKTVVYQLARHINRTAGADRIPADILDRPPSAELKPNQLDEDTLPPYDVLDAILYRYVEQDMNVRRIAEQGFDPSLVRDVAQMVDRSEYKRRQAAPCLKVTGRAFGTGRRLPMAQRFKYE